MISQKSPSSSASGAGGAAGGAAGGDAGGASGGSDGGGGGVTGGKDGVGAAALRHAAIFAWRRFLDSPAGPQGTGRGHPWVATIAGYNHRV